MSENPTPESPAKEEEQTGQGQDLQSCLDREKDFSEKVKEWRNEKHC